MSEPAPPVLPLQIKDLTSEQATARLIEFAADAHASDLFFSTNQDHVAVGMRHLGILRPVARLPLELGRHCLAHIKVMADMNVAERRRPLDGRWVWKRGDGRQVDLRINTLPTLHGEDFALHLLDRDFQLLDLDTLGLLRHDYNHLLDMLNTPGGLILVTGPTGSGKTTTLYACLKYLHNGQRKINTIEDPIEYAVEGIRQSQVNLHSNVHFSDLLRSVLRQAPDVIMVGEIRDPETAETAVRAANSGHLVLATLHAPVAAAAIQSMLGLGVHPHFLSSCLLGVIAQRLLRTLCPQCKSAFDMSAAPHTFDEVRQWLEPGQGQSVHGPGGCAACHQSGYIGRTGVFELLRVGREVRKLIAQKQPTQKIRQHALTEGTIEFRQSALLKVARGETSIEEVMRAVPAEYLGVDD